MLLGKKMVMIGENVKIGYLKSGTNGARTRDLWLDRPEFTEEK